MSTSKSVPQDTHFQNRLFAVDGYFIDSSSLESGSKHGKIYAVPSFESNPNAQNALPVSVHNVLQGQGLVGKANSSLCVPNADGQVDTVVVGFGDKTLASDCWGLAGVPSLLPSSKINPPQVTVWQVLDVTGADSDIISKAAAHNACLGWVLGLYRFDAFKSKPNEPNPHKLVWPSILTEADKQAVLSEARAICLARDLVNLPPNILHTDSFAHIIRERLESYNIPVTEIMGEALVAEYPLIDTVGKASEYPPRLIHFRTGNPDHPRIALVGKGVCFDSGGLQVKTGNGMETMKKDMGGAAHIFALALWIMESKLPVYLDVYLPIVENAIAANAFRPSDVIQTRKGLTVEVGHTDAEGRLILCDCLFEASQSQPEIIIDFATLTGAARVALGMEVPVMFSTDRSIEQELVNLGEALQDPVWPLPLWMGYDAQLDSKVADMRSTGGGDGLGGAIIAALFLKRFVGLDVPWLHFDLSAWNTRARAGRPMGGEAMAIRTVFHWLQNRYATAKP